ncbi:MULTISPECIES: hypothetical protein [unclassified Microbacterium]|nr:MULTISPECIES: hypothetical protein [unclassified Microbacterium]
MIYTGLNYDNFVIAWKQIGLGGEAEDSLQDPRGLVLTRPERIQT